MNHNFEVGMEIRISRHYPWYKRLWFWIRGIDYRNQGTATITAVEDGLIEYEYDNDPRT